MNLEEYFYQQFSTASKHFEITCAISFSKCRQKSFHPNWENLHIKTGEITSLPIFNPARLIL